MEGTGTNKDCVSQCGSLSVLKSPGLLIKNAISSVLPPRNSNSPNLGWGLGFWILYGSYAIAMHAEVWASLEEKEKRREDRNLRNIHVWKIWIKREAKKKKDRRPVIVERAERLCGIWKAMGGLWIRISGQRLCYCWYLQWCNHFYPCAFPVLDQLKFQTTLILTKIMLKTKVLIWLK